MFESEHTLKEGWSRSNHYQIMLMYLDVYIMSIFLNVKEQNFRVVKMGNPARLITG